MPGSLLGVTGYNHQPILLKGRHCLPSTAIGRERQLDRQQGWSCKQICQEEMNLRTTTAEREFSPLVFATKCCLGCACCRMEKLKITGEELLSGCWHLFVGLGNVVAGGSKLSVVQRGCAGTFLPPTLTKGE